MLLTDNLNIKSPENDFNQSDAGRDPAVSIL